MARGKPPRGAISPMQFFSKLKWLDDRPLVSVIEEYRVAIFNSVLWTFDADGRPTINMALTGRAKKCWETLDLCIAALYRFCVWPSPWGNDCAIITSDLDQANDDLSLIKKLIDKNPILAMLEVRVREIIRKDTGAKLQILPAQDASGLHGKTFCFLGIDELHTQIDYATVEALAQDPLRADTVTWMASYSPLVARAGTPLVDYLELGRSGADERFHLSWYDATWSTDPAFRDPSMSPEQRANPSWDDDRGSYLKQQKRRLPAAQYKRLHLNLPGPAKGAKFDPESVLAAVAKGRKRVGFDETVEEYIAGVDHSGGQNNAAVLCIGHQDPETERIIMDVLQVVTSPHVPRDAINRFVATLKEYNCFAVWGDRYGGSTFSHDHQARGFTYRPPIVNKSVLYDALEPALAGGDCEWLDIPELIDEALGLIEKNGKTDHPVGMFDDRVNATAAMTYIARQREFEAPIIPIFVADNTSHPTPDRWSPRYWSEAVPMPFAGGAADYAKDEFTGSIGWSALRSRGKI